MYTINDQISQLIDEKFQQGNITERKLCLGICSRTSLRNFRDGSTITDFNIVQILLQRMGKSANKLEVVTSRDIMEKYIRQLDFDKSLDEDNSLRAKELLELFRIEAEELNKSNVSKLFYYRNCAAYYQYIETDYKRALELIKTANELTLPEYKHNKLTEYLISTIELENLLAECLYTYYVYNDNYALIAVRERLNEIYVYMNTHVTDEEEISAILPKYMMVSAYLYAAGKEYDRAVRDAEKGLERLRDSMLMQNALPLLDIIVKYGANCKLLEPYKNYVDYYNVLSELTEEMSASNYKYDSLFVRCRRNVFHDDAMLIKAQRIINKKSQQEIADEISVDPYVISTYESGKHSPNKSTYPKLMTALGLKVGRQSTLLIDKSFKSSEILYSINNMIIHGEYDAAREQLAKLENCIDMDYSINKRVIGRLKNSILFNCENPDYESILNFDIELLNDTYPIINMVPFRPPFIDEINLIQQIAKCYLLLGHREEAFNLIKRTMEVTINCGIDIRLQERTYGLCCSNLPLLFFGDENDDISIPYSNIKYDLEIRSLSLIELSTSAMANILFKVDKTMSEKWMRITYYLSLLLKRPNSAKIAQINLAKCYK